MLRLSTVILGAGGAVDLLHRDWGDAAVKVGIALFLVAFELGVA